MAQHLPVDEAAVTKDVRQLNRIHAPGQLVRREAVAQQVWVNTLLNPCQTRRVTKHLLDSTFGQRLVFLGASTPLQPHEEPIGGRISRPAANVPLEPPVQAWDRH